MLIELDPRDYQVAVERARADQFTEWYNSTLWANVRPLLVQLVRTPEDKRDQGLIDSSLKASLAAVALLPVVNSRFAVSAVWPLAIVAVIAAIAAAVSVMGRREAAD